jgi:hypothetical protein
VKKAALRTQQATTLIIVSVIDLHKLLARVGRALSEIAARSDKARHVCGLRRRTQMPR